MYNKTALKKIKKDDLVQMYLDLQAKNYDDKMEEVIEKCCNNAIDETVEELQKENEKLREELDTWHEALDEPVGGLEDLQSEINLHFWKRCKGPWDTHIEKINQDDYEDDEVVHYIDAGRKAVLKDGRIVMSKD
jgi:FtsZ-binding cell division protein ZapB